MKDSDKELLSTILDEDVSEFEMKRILNEMQSNAEVSSVYQRYNIIGHAIRKELPSQLNVNFADEVMRKLATEDSEKSAHELLQNESDHFKFKTAFGLAIAASVAIFSFLSFQNYFQTETEIESAPVVADNVVEPRDIQRVSAEELQNIASNPEAVSDLDSYIMNHAEHASSRVSVPYVRIVGYEQEQ